jgi:UDP-N-acetylmuramate: L-alanyl-gamma-D-glutamyl-meso-diaminopimelate ligase
MVFEGDEYLSSPLDRRPKFHWYHPHVALLSGIAWDHINVFPTFENYKDQFAKFIWLIEKDGTLIYSKDDEVLQEVVSSQQRSDLKIQSYGAASHHIEDGVTFLDTGNRSVPLKVFGKHNLMNLNGARLVCHAIGIDDNTFYDAIESFEGTANRLELIEKNDRFVMFKDFAHAPSKVKATISAVQEQFPERELVACLELHTFSSLNKAFLDQYNGSFQDADKGCVYYNPHTVAMKKLEKIDPEDIRKAFNKKEELRVFTDSGEMISWLKEQGTGPKVFLMMSSGNFNGINFKELAQQLENE